ncbi:hypothetical protein BN1058_01609 [Paraliobacillus sp. PM-2]|uniref:DUF2877 domain-containing protein n=1 Tax=Paraliobacillus sp. PM-2 TaxID=1462524 RepID=UPI00061BF16D|nr:DUF2877 domain-containing protein [Paraliobacillus sp. PM-2]CQR47300.1 hypothetical protein BN1058_01609 [Paraliobacillus sp. PM-2]
MYLYVNQIDDELKHYLSSKKKDELVGEVHSVFDRVINIHTETEDRLISVASKDIVQSPDMMKTTNDVNFKAWNVSLKQSKKVFLIGNYQLSVGEHIIDFEKAISRRVKIEKLSYSPNKFGKVIDKIDMFLALDGKQAGILNAYQYLFNQQKANVNSKLTIHQRALMDCLILFQRSYDPKQLKGFIGLGIGLTPSGDDFLTGLLTVLQAYDGYPISEIMSERQAWLDLIKSRTTTVSYYMLKHCLQGSTNEGLRQIIIKAENVSKKDMEQVLSIGSTSGTDMLVGVVTGYRMIRNLYLLGGKEDGIESYH